MDDDSIAKEVACVVVFVVVVVVTASLWEWLI